MVNSQKGSLTAANCNMKFLVTLCFFTWGSFQVVGGNLFGVSTPSMATISRTITTFTNAFTHLLSWYVYFQNIGDTKTMTEQFHTVVHWNFTFWMLWPALIAPMSKFLLCLETNMSLSNAIKNDQSIDVQLICDVDAVITNRIVRLLPCFWWECGKGNNRGCPYDDASYHITDLHVYLVKSWFKHAAWNMRCLVLHNYLATQ